MKTVKSPDLKAPRYRESFASVLNNKLLHKVKEKSVKAKDLTIKDLRKVIKAFNGEMWNHVIESRDGIELPESLGNIYIGTCPAPKRKNIDMKKSIELGYAVEHRNWETDGNLGKVIYSNYGNKYSFRNPEAWRFKTGRLFKRTVSAKYPENWTIYKKIEKHMVISAQIKADIKKEHVLKRSHEIPVNYNEFQLD